jgi:hypothetical protein
MEDALKFGKPIPGLTLRTDIAYVPAWSALIAFDNLEVAEVPEFVACLVVKKSSSPQDHVPVLKEFCKKYGLTLALHESVKWQLDTDFKPIRTCLTYTIFAPKNTFPKLFCGLIMSYCSDINKQEVKWTDVYTYFVKKNIPLKQQLRGLYFGIFHRLLTLNENKLCRLR